MTISSLPEAGILINPKRWENLDRFDNDTLMSYTEYSTKNFKPTLIKFNKKMPEANKKGLIQDEDFLEMLMCYFHEERHCEQLTKISQSDTPLGRDLALAFIAITGNPGWYKNNYYYMPFEVDAECNALMATYAFLKESFSGEIKDETVDRVMLNYANMKCKEPLYPLRKFGAGKYKNVEILLRDIADCYEKSQKAQVE